MSGPDQRRAELLADQYEKMVPVIDRALESNDEALKAILDDLSVRTPLEASTFVELSNPRDVELYLTGVSAGFDGYLKYTLTTARNHGHLPQAHYNLLLGHGGIVLSGFYIALEPYLPHLRSSN
jgi:hypothetical protein